MQNFALEMCADQTCFLCFSDLLRNCDETEPCTLCKRS